MKHLKNIEVFCSLGLILLLGAGFVTADDRVLLRAEGAPANVLVIVDTGASMTHDATSNTINFLAGGDDEGLYTDALIDLYGTAHLETLLGIDYVLPLSQGAKLPQAKGALRTFFNAGFDFNYGFSYYEKTDIEIRYLNFIYRVSDFIDTTGDGVPDMLQPAMLDGTQPGSFLRFGDFENQRGNTDPDPVHPIRYGRNGEDTHVANWDPFGTNTGSWSNQGVYQPDNGDTRLASFLVDSTGTPLADLTFASRKSQNMFYYPAYFFGTNGIADGLSWGRWVRNGLKGNDTWEDVATHNGIDTSNPQWKRVLHDYVIEDITMVGDPWGQPLGTLGTSNQIGSQTLYIMEMYQIYQNDSLEWRHVMPGSPVQVTEVQYMQHFVLYDHDWTEELPGANTLSAVDYTGSADCVGYLDHGQGEPIVKISQPDPGDGSTTDQRWEISSYLDPQTTPVFYFPDQLPEFLPTVRTDYIPLTETMTAIGRRPIKDSINEAKQYFDGTVDNWDDPLANCRMNFVLLITDGIETCSNTTAPCSAASNISPVPVYVIYFGSDQNALNPDLSVVECVADNSGGLFFSAANEQEMVAALMQIAMDIEERTRGFSSPIVPSVQSSSEQIAYISTFTPKDGRSIWRGHLRAYPIDPLTGLLKDLRIDGTPNPLAANWDAGDTLSLRPANSRKMYFGGPTYTGEMPGETFPFIYQSGATSAEEFSRWWLGEKIFFPDPWYTWDPIAMDWVEDPAKQQALQDVINFTRGVTMERDPTDPDIITVWGRDPNRYGWCSATGDVNDGDAEPCQTPGALLRGVEKLGDIFHSTPQLMGAPKCFTCWFQNSWSYRDDRSTTDDPWDGFFGKNERRRQVIFTGADDGSLHAFEAGMWDPDGATIDGDVIDPIYDKGTGRELFAWLPNATMKTLDVLAFGGDHRWTVDATPTVADVYIDPEFSATPADADREWRTVVLFGQRRGGRSYVAIDVTHPDPLDSDGVPSSPAIGDVELTAWTEAQSTTRDVVCVTGNESGCDRQWPEFRWEFEDLDDALNLPRDEDNNNTPDLGQTWSRPLVGFLRVDTDNDADTPGDAKMVAFVGGGYSPDGLYTLDQTGNFVYGIDIETGGILFKVQSAGMVPSAISALDANLDGFIEMIYWADTAGYVYHMDLSADGVFGTVTINGNSETRVTNWVPEVIFKAGPNGDGVGQPFFQRPTLVPVGFEADGSIIIAFAVGSGNRDNIMEANAIAHRFYVVVDTAKADGTVITEADLDGFTHNTVAAADANFIGGGAHGWFLEFFDTANAGEDWEKVNTAALILQSTVIFSTFNPSSEVQEVPILDEDGDVIGYACRRGGNARTYLMNLSNGNGLDGGDRFIQHDSGTAMATEPVVYLGADGEIHVIQALDNLKMEEPMESFNAILRALNWKEH